MDEQAHRARPLTGLVVLDLTIARAGPTAVRHLADWGADVIRVLPPDAGQEVISNRHGSDYQNLHRNKRAITLDLKNAEDHADFLRMVKKADVLVENMRVPVKHRLKISYDDVRPLNPRLVYGSISGFGQDGPYAARAGVDQIAQGMGGLMSVTGPAGGEPTRAGIAVADLTAGNLLALAIMMALFERTQTGVGRWVHTSLLESQIFMMDFQAARYLMDGEVPEQVGNGHPTLASMGTFPTRDGHVNIAPASPSQWRSFCTALGKSAWLSRPEWRGADNFAARRDEIVAEISAQTRTETTAHWVQTLEQAGIPCGPIYAMDQVFADPQVAHLGIAAEVPHPTRGTVRLVGSPLHVDGVDKALRVSAPTEGGDADAILRWARDETD